MTKTLEEDGDVIVSPDDWAELVAKPAPLDIRAELQRQVDEYLAHGGKVQEFEPGESALEPSKPLWSFPVGKAAAPNHELRDAGIARRIEAAKAPKRKLQGVAAPKTYAPRDPELVAALNLALGSATTAKDLCRKVNISPEKLERLLVQFYKTDPRAARFLKRSREDRNDMLAAVLLPRIRNAIASGAKGALNIATICHTSSTTLNKLCAKYRIQIPSAAERMGVRGWVNCANAECGRRHQSGCKFCPHCGHASAKSRGEERDGQS